MYALAKAKTVDRLTCGSHGCSCVTPNSSVIYCNFRNENFRVSKDISANIRQVKIFGQNFTIDIPDQKYGESWSLIESLEIQGDAEKMRRVMLPYNFAIKLHRITNMIIKKHWTGVNRPIGVCKYVLPETFRLV